VLDKGPTLLSADFILLRSMMAEIRLVEKVNEAVKR